MKRYTVAFAVAEVYVHVEAETPKQAEKLAEERLSDVDISLCHSCADKVEPCDPYVVSTAEDA